MLLQFPSEPLASRALRRDALERFRWTCRIPVIRTFGAEATDFAIFVTSCGACAAQTARMGAVGDLDADMALDGLIAELRARAGRTRYGWRPAACPACRAPDPEPISAVFARYMPEIERDLHIELVFGRHRVVAVELHLVALDGSVEHRPRPDGELQVLAEFGAPVSTRALWRALITEHVYDDEMVVRALQEGYVLGLRPFTDDPAEAEAMLAPFGPLIEHLRTGVGGGLLWDAITFFYEREEGGIEVPFADSYNAWLGGYAHEIRNGLIEPFVVADSDVFVQRLADHAARFGVRAERDSGEGTLFVRFRSGRIDIRLNLGPLFFRILHSGLTFDRGIATLFAREIRALAEARKVPGLLAELLPEHTLRVVRGQFVEVFDADGERVAFGDLVRLATHYELDDPDGRSALVAELLAADPLDATLHGPATPG